MRRIIERVADRYDVVVGVDTHTDTHTAAVVDRLGGVLAQVTVSTDPDGLSRLLAFAVAHTPPQGRRLWAVEGTRSHGQGLCRLLTAADEPVCEAPKPPLRPVVGAASPTSWTRSPPPIRCWRCPLSASPCPAATAHARPCVCC